MNLLKEGIQNNSVVEAGTKRKITIDGITQAYNVYKIRLDLLFYNDQNDRIATWISQYKNENSGQVPDLSDKEAYNSVIEEFIVKSNPSAIKATKTNIELVDQREPGVVLNDGRIIDGNRRFTCLRQLSEKNERFQYMEAIILDRDIENNAKQIKMLELQIQHGEESKVDYNPVDKLVGLYNDVEVTKLLTLEEYAKSVNEPPKEVSKQLEIANYMVEFLDFINAPEQYYLVRDMQIIYAFEELPKMLNKCSTSDEKEDLKHVVFTNLLVKPEADVRKMVRNINKIAGTEYSSDFIEEQMEITEQVLDSLPEKVNATVIRDVIRANDEVVSALENSTEKTKMKVDRTEIKNRPIQLAEKATNYMESIDNNILLKMNDSELRRLDKQLSRLEAVIEEIRRDMQ